MHCLGSILGEERIEEIVEIIFFSEVIFHKISWFLYMLLYFNFLSESKWHIWDPFGGWFGSTWSISAGRGSLKSCYGVKLCLMLAENAVLCQTNYDGCLCYFFYLIITNSFQINIHSFVDFPPWVKPRNTSVGWGEPKLSKKFERFKNTVQRIGAVKCRYMKVFQRTRNERNLFFTPYRPDR